MHCWKKIAVTTLLLILFCYNSSEATKWFEYDNEDGVVGNNLPSSTSGPYYFEYGSPGTYQSDSIRGKFADDTYLQYIQIWNPRGTYGPAWSESNPITVVSGNTYYLGAFLRFERIGGNSIWHNVWDFDKLLEWTGSGFRWIIESGYPDATTTYVSDKFTFAVYASEAINPTTKAYFGGWSYFAHNKNGYTKANPFWCNYEKWYAVVMAITARTTNDGTIALWINGTQVMSYTGPTMESGAYIGRIAYTGTIGQPEYDAPAHKRQFDRIMLTDNWQDIINGGYMTNAPLPAPPSGLRIVPPSN